MSKIRMRRSAGWRLATVCLLAVLPGACGAIAAPAAVADDGAWPHWRGPQRNGTTSATSKFVAAPWTEEQPLWAAEVGRGSSSPLVADGMVFVLGHNGQDDVVEALDLDTGRSRWRQTYRSPAYGRHATGDKGLYGGPTSTPEYDPQTGLLYTLSCDGELRCWNARQKGQLLWRRNLYDDFQMPQRPRIGRSGHRDYGYTTAPLLWKSSLLLEVGSPSEGTVIALAPDDGRQLWASQARDLAGHTGGMAIMEVGDIPCVATLAFEGLLVIAIDGPRRGETLATYPWKTDFANNIAGPAVLGDNVLITSAYNQDAICRLRITPGGAEKVWEQKRRASKTCTPVIHQGRIYWAWDRLHCLDWETGRPVWEGPRVGDAGSCIITGDDKLIAWVNQGELLLCDVRQPDGGPGKGRYQELARRRLPMGVDVWPHIAWAGDRLLCKDRVGKLICLKIAQP